MNNAAILGIAVTMQGIARATRDIRRVATQMDEATAEAKRMTKAFTVLDKANARPKIEADTAGAQAKLLAVSARLSQIARTRVRAVVGVDTDSGLRGLVRFQGALGDTRVMVGPLAASLRTLPAALAVMLPLLAGAGAGVVALASSAGAAALGLGALGLAAGALVAPFAILATAVGVRFARSFEIAGTAAHRLKVSFNELSEAASVALRPATTGIMDALARAMGDARPLVAGMSSEFTRFGEAVQQSIGRLSAEFTSPRWAEFFGMLTNAAARAVGPLTGMFTAVARVMRDVAWAAMPALLTALGDLEAKLSGLGSGSITALRSTINGLVAQTRTWLGLFSDLGESMFNVLKAVNPQAQSLVGWLARGAEKLRAWTDSAAGQQRIQEFFAATLPVFRGLLPLLGEMVKSVGLFAQLAGPAAQLFLRGFTAIFEVINKVLRAFLQLPEGVQTFIGILLIMSGPLKIVTFLFAALRVAIVALRAPLLALTLLMAANPFVLAALAIAALVAAFVVAYRESETFRNVVDTAFKGVKDAFGWLLNAAKDVFGWLKKNWPTIQAVIVNPIRDAASWVWDKVKWVAGKLKGAWGGIKTAASTAWDRVKKAIIDPVRSAAGWVWDKIKWLGSTLERGFGRIWEIAKNFAGGLKDRIVSGFKTGINFIIDQLNRLIRAFNKLPGPNLGLIGALAQGGQIAQYAQGGITAGGVVRAPMLMMGEDAPRHPEWVIPTNPAYRSRALALLGAAGSDLGVRGLAHGGRTAPGGGVATQIDQSREVHLHEHGDRNYYFEADEDRATRKQLWQLRVAGLA